MCAQLSDAGLEHLNLEVQERQGDLGHFVRGETSPPQHPRDSTDV